MDDLHNRLNAHPHNVADMHLSNDRQIVDQRETVGANITSVSSRFEGLHAPKRRKNHFRYRGRLEIASFMLKEAESGALRSRIQYRAYLSSQQLKSYLEFLTANGLMEYNSNDRRYYTTQKGHDLIQACERLAGAIQPNIESSRGESDVGS